MNKAPSTRTFFMLGMIISLGSTLVAFEWTSFSKRTLSFNSGENIDLVDEPILIPPPEKPRKTEEYKENEQKPKNNHKILADEIEVTTSEPNPQEGVLTDDDDEDLFYDKFYKDSVIDDIPPVIGTADLLIKPYFNSCKQKSNAAKFVCTCSQINGLIEKNIIMPEALRATGKSEKVTAVFIVNEKGIVDEIKVLNEENLNPSTVREVKRLIRMIPVMVPGMKDGRAVRTAFVMPFNFVVN